MSDDDGIEDLLDQNQYNFLDLIGRFGQLKAQDNTKKEIRELKNLLAQQQEKEAALPKCPWCAGAIVENVFKCRHCASDIEWVSINGLVPCRPQDKEDVEKKETALQKQLVEKARLEKKRQEEKRQKEKKRQKENLAVKQSQGEDYYEESEGYHVDPTFIVVSLVLFILLGLFFVLMAK